MTRLSELAHAPHATIDTIAAHLDALDHAGRMRELAKTTRDDQRALWVKAAAAPDLTYAHFVPDGVPAKTAVVHHGRNTLPLPGQQKFFRKPMARPDDGSARAFGYNDAPTQSLVGPGYFVLVPTKGNAEWERRGAWVVDYFQVPDGAVPSSWPKVVPNTQGLQRFVYHGTRDFMRRISAHVSIGAAFKGEKPLDHYFTLCREDR
jgi:hypothetical protein